MVEIVKDNLKDCLGFEWKEDDVELEEAIEGK
jgi:hypothetical protein